MKKQIILSLYLLQISLSAADFVVDSGAHVTGDGITYYKDMNLKNSGTIKNSGEIIIAGDKNSDFGGSGETNLNTVRINKKNAVLTITGKIKVNNSLHVDSKVDLQGNKIDLGTTGVIHDTTGFLKGDSGTISVLPNLNAGKHANISGIGISLEPKEHLGQTSITRGFSILKFGEHNAIKRWYRIEPTNVNIETGLVISYNADETVSDKTLRLYRSSDGGKAWRATSSVLDSISNKISAVAQGIGDLWTVFPNRPPEIQSVALSFTVSGKPTTITTSMISATDADGDPLTFHIGNGENYTITDSTLFTDASFQGTISVPFWVYDGLDSSKQFIASIQVRPEGVNSAPIISAANIKPIEKNRFGKISKAMLTWSDADGDSVSLIILDGNKYSVLKDFTVVPDSGYIGKLKIPLQITDGTDTSLVFNAEASVFEKIADFHKGQIQLSNTFEVQVYPNPAPINAHKMLIRTQRGKFDKMTVKIFDNLGNLISAGDAKVRGLWFTYFWDFKQNLAPGTYAAWVIYKKDGKTVQVNKKMLGIMKQE